MTNPLDHRFFVVAWIGTGEVKYAGRELYSAAVALVPGTTFGGGLTEPEARQLATLRIAAELGRGKGVGK